jgi:phage-related minor tail protein
VTGRALRQCEAVPAQITDIVSGLATGQRPLSVLLQQGGQLKDMFGGIVPAAKALGSSLFALINPATLLAGAAVALFAAWKSGSDEQVAFQKAIINTGNYAGYTAQQLQGLSQELSRTTRQSA